MVARHTIKAKLKQLSSGISFIDHHAQLVPEAPGLDELHRWRQRWREHRGRWLQPILCIVVLRVSIFLFCVLATSVSVWKALASATLAALLLSAAGCFKPKGWFYRTGHKVVSQWLLNNYNEHANFAIAHRIIATMNAQDVRISKPEYGVVMVVSEEWQQLTWHLTNPVDGIKDSDHAHAPGIVGSNMEGRCMMHFIMFP